MTASPRQLALNLLLRWETLSSPPPLPDRAAPDDPWKNLPTRDRAFTYDLLTGILRWRGLLDAVIASRLRQPLDQLDLPVRAILWLGAYQLLLQGGTTSYAAVHTSVSLARQHPAAAPAAGLVNAVLRNITRLHPTLQPNTQTLDSQVFTIDFATQVRFNHNIFPNPHAAPTAHLAAVRSHPAPYVDRLRTLYGDAQAADLLLRNNLRPAITLRADTPTLDAPALAGLIAHPDTPQFLIASTGWNPPLESLIHQGALSPQDPTAALPVRRLQALIASGKLPNPLKILDLCAGLGTKSLQLARAFPNAHITAADSDPAKLLRLQSRAHQVKQPNISTLPAENLRGQRFDLILVDVPCSNTGVLSKRIQSRWRWPSLDHPALHTLQARLLTQARSLLSPGGTLLYATCSIDPAENSELARKTLQNTPLEELTTLPSLGPSAQTSPHDGGYYAIFTPDNAVQ